MMTGAWQSTENVAADGSGEAAEQRVFPPQLLRHDACQFTYEEKCSPRTSHMQWLTYGLYRVAAGGGSGELHHPREETLLFCLEGTQRVSVEGTDYELAHYDTLYIPRASTYEIADVGLQAGLIAVCRAAAESAHPVAYSCWREVQQDERRIRRLDGKDVYIMFDVDRPADRLVAGYTIYQPHVRAWPPHNHTDQEEVYIFTQGHGAIEVYPDEQRKTFVHSVGPLDAATIPPLNYHPVFSYDEPLHFIWCLAGARYWVGDKHEEFMDASVDRLTT